MEDRKGAVRSYLKVRPRMGLELKHKSGLGYVRENGVMWADKVY